MRGAAKMWQTLAVCGVWAVVVAPRAQAYTANKVWVEALPTGVFRVHVGYTIPEVKEFREAQVEFRSQKEANALYWDLLRGADFYPGALAQRRFIQQPLQPDPW